MATGEIKPQEEEDEDCELEEAAALPPAANPGVSGEKSRDSGFSGNSEKSPDIPDLLLKLQKAVKKLRI
jgi:hypothetical protein